MQAQAWEDEEQLEGYVRKRKGKILDQNGLDFYKRKFIRYRRKGVIIQGDYGADEWILTDGLTNTRIHFGVSRTDYGEGAAGWIGLDYECFQECMRAYMVMLLGKATLLSLKQNALELRRLARTAQDKTAISPYRWRIIEFLEVLPGNSPERDVVIEQMIEKNRHTKRKRSGKRELAPFHEYLEFDRGLKLFWERAGEGEKTTYFPVWFWWNLTMILPLRVIEFLVTPLDCIVHGDGGYLLTVRRSKRKKAGEQVAYRVEEDYPENRYPIPDMLAGEILAYNGRVLGERPRDNWSLLLSGGSGFGYFTYTEMEKLLERFRAEKLGGTGERIRLGDTRHLAMINLILSGGAPEICRELAGHEDIDISSHYYSNLSPLIDSAVYRGQAGKGASFSGSLAGLPAERKIRVQDGWCSNDRILQLDIEECLKNYRAAGHMGECRGCAFFNPDGPSLRLEVQKERADAVDRSWDVLIRAVDLLRKDRGTEEDLLALMARLQNESYKYVPLAAENIGTGKGEKNGTAKKEQF